ncbi:MAG: hypothetical protein HKM23_08265 [Nitrosopumilus sp.]|nr:hypothetical protein [Nitrosopumilus sp.]NNL59221.1 hypothetical protein [Nitrosopumilus sp.]
MKKPRYDLEKITKMHYKQMEKIAKYRNEDINKLYEIATGWFIQREEDKRLYEKFGQKFGFEIHKRCCPKPSKYAIKKTDSELNWLVCKDHYEDDFFKNNAEKTETIDDYEKYLSYSP